MRPAFLAMAIATVIAARRSAERHGSLATIGKVRVAPGGVNAIPSAVTGWLDARGADARAVRQVVAEVEEVTVELGGLPVIGTGAGHDAGILANAGAPTAMLFIRNPTGVSHSPAEWANEADCLAGVAALAGAVEELAGAHR